MMPFTVRNGNSCNKRVLIVHLQEDVVTCILKVATSAAFSFIWCGLCEVSWLTLHFRLAMFYFKTNGQVNVGKAHTLTAVSAKIGAAWIQLVDHSLLVPDLE